MAKGKAIVIGGGVAGLAAAIRLKIQGWQVDLFEASDQLGGKMGELEKDGYRWDSGPSLFTMPQFVEELFALHNKKMTDYIPYKKKSVVCNYFWDDGETFSMSAQPDKAYQELAEKFNEAPEKLRSYFDRSLEKYQLTSPLFIENSLHLWKNYLKKDTFRALAKFPRLEINESLDQVNRKWFNHPKLIQLLNRFATYNGSSPYQTSGIMSMIPALEMHFGTYFPKNGMRSIAEGMHKLAEEVGVAIHLEKKVDRILVEKNAVQGVQSENESHQADVVVSNMDVFFSYQQLLNDAEAAKKVEKHERSSSALIFYWGVKQSFPQLDLHNIFFSEDYEAEFKSLFKTKDFADDLTVYLNISSKDKPDDAPEGRENWFVMVNAPENNGQDWVALKEKARALIIKKLDRILNIDLEDLIECELVLDPLTIEQNTQSYKGSLYGTSSNSRNAAFLRQPNFSKKYQNLYFCGGSAHPGGGIPLCLQSAKITAKMIN